MGLHPYWTPPTLVFSSLVTHWQPLRTVLKFSLWCFSKEQLWSPSLSTEHIMSPMTYNNVAATPNTWWGAHGALMALLVNSQITLLPQKHKEESHQSCTTGLHCMWWYWEDSNSLTVTIHSHMFHSYRAEEAAEARWRDGYWMADVVDADIFCPWGPLNNWKESGVRMCGVVGDVATAWETLSLKWSRGSWRQRLRSRWREGGAGDPPSPWTISAQRTGEGCGGWER